MSSWLVIGFDKIARTPDERAWLEKACPYFTPAYLDYLAAFRFDPQREVAVAAVPAQEQPGEDEQQLADLQIEVQGKWRDVILYEVPLMAIVSQAYFEHVDTDWSMDGQEGGSRAALAGAIMC